MTDLDIITLARKMAATGGVPTNVGGWRMAADYAGSIFRPRGIVGEVVYDGAGCAYVCVSGDYSALVPNTHPDYTPRPGTIWASVPHPSEIDWRYVPDQYRPAVHLEAR